MEFETRIAGIPAIIKVGACTPFRSGRVGHIDNWLPDDEAECEFTICDRKGYAAAWLERKATAKELREIESKIAELIEESIEDNYADSYDDY